MPYTVQVPKRLTHKYNSHYSHLDEWDYDNAITLKIICGRFTPAWLCYLRDKRAGSPDMSEVGESTFQVVVPRGVPDTEVRTAIYQEFSRGGCDHEYDCCGCPSAYAIPTKVGRQKWRVTQVHSRNY